MLLQIDCDSSGENIDLILGRKYVEAHIPLYVRS